MVFFWERGRCAKHDHAQHYVRTKFLAALMNSIYFLQYFTYTMHESRNGKRAVL
jgi:hypothetical protein